jgi:hypothetical protein
MKAVIRVYFTRKEAVLVAAYLVGINCPFDVRFGLSAEFTLCPVPDVELNYDEIERQWRERFAAAGFCPGFLAAQYA